MPEFSESYGARRLVDVYHLGVCADGHVARAVRQPNKAWNFRHDCGGWAWEDGKFCPRCGKRLGRSA